MGSDWDTLGICLPLSAQAHIWGRVRPREHLPLQRYFCQEQVGQGQWLRRDSILGSDEMTGLSIPAGLIPVLTQQALF